MQKRINFFRKISLILGIATLLLGLVPVPVLSQVGVVSADDTPVEDPPLEEPLAEEPPADDPLVEEPLVEEPLAEEPPAEEPLVEDPPVEDPPVEELPTDDPLVEEPLVEDPPVEDPPAEDLLLPMALQSSFVLLALPVSVGPTNESPEDLGLPEDQNAPGYQDDCDQPGNDCEKAEGDDLGDVNDVGEGETFDNDADVVVIKAGTNEFFFSKDGPECDPDVHPYCLVFNGDGTITVIRNEESRDVKDISNIQFWNPPDDEEPCPCDNLGILSENGCDCDVYGCPDPEALNYNPEATIDDGSCEYEEEERFDLVLDPYCVKIEGGYFIAWEIVNPNDFDVEATWLLDGNAGGGMMAPGVNFIGYTEDGPATHTLEVEWDFGEASSSYAAVCAPTITTDPPPPGTPPVAIENPVIPVTGADLAGQSLLSFGGVLLIGLSLLFKGIANKIKQ